MIDNSSSSSSSSLYSNDEQLLSKSNHYQDTDNEQFPWQDVRLPRFIQPIHYDIYMQPDIDSLINEGNVSIQIKVMEWTEFLIIHVKKLNITNISLSLLSTQVLNNQSEMINIRKYSECIKLEQLYIEFDQQLRPDHEYRLSIGFWKKIEDQLEGFYVSSYYNQKLQQKRHLLTTHFEPTLARSAFPCFDEPAMKGK